MIHIQNGYLYLSNDKDRVIHRTPTNLKNEGSYSSQEWLKAKKPPLLDRNDNIGFKNLELKKQEDSRPELYEDIDALEIIDTVSIPLSTIKDMIHAAAKEESRYYLHGIHVVNGTLNACDGHRLIQVKQPDIKVSKEYIINLDVLKHLIKTKDEIITFSFYKHHIASTDNGFIFKCIDAVYPNIAKLPRYNTSTFTVKVDEFKKALKEINSKNITLTGETDTITLTGETDNAVYRYVIENQISNSFELIFKKEYLLDILRIVNEETITFCTTNEITDPSTIYLDGGNIEYILMGMRNA